MVMMDIDSPAFYRKLPVVDKARYHGRGCVYNTGRGNENSWRIEWSSGKRSTLPNGKILYYSLTVWGTYAEARALLDLIVVKPHCPLDEAKEIIAPYVEWRGHRPNQGGAKKRVIVGLLPVSKLQTPQALRRQQIYQDYWRLRLLDTLEEYRRLGDD